MSAPSQKSVQASNTTSAVPWDSICSVPGMGERDHIVRPQTSSRLILTQHTTVFTEGGTCQPVTMEHR